MRSPEELVRRARVRCKHHREPRVSGFGREYLLAEIEQAIADEHPELDRGEVFELVQEWLRGGGGGGSLTAGRSARQL